ncbi:META domain-containing protein [Sphingomonas sp.]|uniref:META domain-containing protein n=1 Tax=Sphingomonas sp. TaxID=28214 RepID=UPI002FD99747
MMMHFQLILAALCAALQAAPATNQGLGRTSNSTMPTLIDGEWTVQLIDGRPPVPSHPPRLSFAGGSLKGSTGCHPLAGRFEFSRGRVHFGHIVIDKGGCPSVALDTQERKIANVLHERLVVSSNRAGKLVMTSASGNTITLVGHSRK